MSIIHDALKKVQQGLASKAEAAQATPTADQKSSGYIYNDTPAVETLPPRNQETVSQKPPLQNKIKSLLALLCAIAITVGSGYYIYLQFRNYIPRAQRLAKKTFYQLIHKEEIPDFKTKTAAELVPLARIVIDQPTTTTPAGTTAQTTNVIKTFTPETLNVHGIMADTKGGNLALINDQVYQEGDEIDGAKIIKINLDSITVDINGNQQTIRVKS